MTLLRGQSDVSGIVPMPTDRVDDASTVTDVPVETITWLYLNSGAWASATGQPAGTIVFAKLDFDGVLNSNKATTGSYNNTSLSFGASTRFDTKVSIPDEVFARLQFMNPTDQKAEVAKYLTTNGYYAIDHRFGEIWGIPKAVVADDTVSYSYKAPVVGASGPSANVLVASPTATPTNTEVAVTNSATAILASTSSSRRGVLIKNGAVAITLGPSGVTSATNTKTLDPGDTVILDNYGGVLYGITASGTSNVQVFTW